MVASAMVPMAPMAPFDFALGTEELARAALSRVDHGDEIDQAKAYCG